MFTPPPEGLTGSDLRCGDREMVLTVKESSPCTLHSEMASRTARTHAFSLTRSRWRQQGAVWRMY